MQGWPLRLWRIGHLCLHAPTIFIRGMLRFYLDEVVDLYDYLTRRRRSTR